MTPVQELKELGTILKLAAVALEHGDTLRAWAYVYTTARDCERLAQVLSAEAPQPVKIW